VSFDQQLAGMWHLEGAVASSDAVAADLEAAVAASDAAAADLEAALAASMGGDERVHYNMPTLEINGVEYGVSGDPGGDGDCAMKAALMFAGIDHKADVAGAWSRAIRQLVVDTVVAWKGVNGDGVDAAWEADMRQPGAYADELWWGGFADIVQCRVILASAGEHTIKIDDLNDAVLYSIADDPLGAAGAGVMLVGRVPVIKGGGNAHFIVLYRIGDEYTHAEKDMRRMKLRNAFRNAGEGTKILCEATGLMARLEVRPGLSAPEWGWTITYLAVVQ